jgi:hypothetical protein
MTISCVRAKFFVLGACLASAGVACGQPSRGAPGVTPASIAAASSLYELADPLPLSTARWDPLFDSRIELSTGLLPRHEVRLSAPMRGGWSGTETGLSGFDPSWTLDPMRATYRYTVMERRDWAWKVGITTRLGDADPLRTATFDRSRLGALPQVHMAGEARLATNWLLSVDADGLMTGRGRALDLGVRVDYALGRSFYLYGRYRLSDRYVDGDESSAGLTNSANVGVRYRF